MRTIRARMIMQVMGLTILYSLASAVIAAGDHGTPHKDPIWNWTPEQIIKHVGTVRAGRDLSPKSWPDGARVAVTFSFDIDTEPVWIGFQYRRSRPPRYRCSKAAATTVLPTPVSVPVTNRPRGTDLHL